MDPHGVKLEHQVDLRESTPEVLVPRSYSFELFFNKLTEITQEISVHDFENGARTALDGDGVLYENLRQDHVLVWQLDATERLTRLKHIVHLGLEFTRR